MGNEGKILIFVYVSEDEEGRGEEGVSSWGDARSSCEKQEFEQAEGVGDCPGEGGIGWGAGEDELFVLRVIEEGEENEA